MKRLFFIVLMACIMISAFAEIRVERGRARGNGGGSASVTYYWDTSEYTVPPYHFFNIEDAHGQAEKLVAGIEMGAGGITDCLVNCYFPKGAEDYYMVSLITGRNDEGQVCYLVYAQNLYLDGYSEDLYQKGFQGFNSYNSARAQFDSLCDKYYGKISQ